MGAESEIRRIEIEMHTAGWAEHTSLHRELRAWGRLSAEVNTYAATIDDYTNDVCSRDYIAQFATRASAELRADLDARVAPADDRFRTATVPDVDGRVGRYFRISPDDGWWWHRRPLSGPLATYLSEV